MIGSHLGKDAGHSKASRAAASIVEGSEAYVEKARHNRLLSKEGTKAMIGSLLGKDAGHSKASRAAASIVEGSKALLKLRVGQEERPAFVLTV
jgi:hypothetical protein